MFDLTRHYRVLELDPGASLEDIDLAYKDLVFVWHPDRLPADNNRLQAKAQEKLKALNQAREALRSRLLNTQSRRYQPYEPPSTRWYQPVYEQKSSQRPPASPQADAKRAQPPQPAPQPPQPEPTRGSRPVYAYTHPEPKQTPETPSRPINPDLSGVDWSGQDLKERYLEGRNLSHANLSKADLSDAFLHRVNLSGANLHQANLFRANLLQANLSQADLSEANLVGADLSGADLRGANLTNARMGPGDRWMVKLTGANLNGATLPDGTIHGG